MKEKKDEQIKIYRLGNQTSFKNVLFCVYDTINNEGDRKIADMFRNEVMSKVNEQGAEIFVASYNSKILGFAYIEAKERAIKLIYVIDSAKNQGIEERLAQASCDYFKTLS